MSTVIKDAGVTPSIYKDVAAVLAAALNRDVHVGADGGGNYVMFRYDGLDFLISNDDEPFWFVVGTRAVNDTREFHTSATSSSVSVAKIVGAVLDTLRDRFYVGGLRA